MLHRNIVHQVSRLEVIGPIENHIRTAEKPLRILRHQIRNVRLDRDLRIEQAYLSRCRFRFRQRLASVCLIEQRLSLKIAQFHVITIDDADRAHPRSRQYRDGGSARRTASDDSNRRAFDATLPLLPDPVKELLP